MSGYSVPPNVPLIAGFQMWARSERPQSYAQYALDHYHARAALHPSARIVALVDTSVPEAMFRRSHEEIRTISETYSTTLLGLGFDEVLFSPPLAASLTALRLRSVDMSLAQVARALPQHKGERLPDLSAEEVLVFGAQTGFLRIAIHDLRLNYLLAGVGSRRFLTQALRSFSLADSIETAYFPMEAGMRVDDPSPGPRHE